MSDDAELNLVRKLIAAEASGQPDEVASVQSSLMQDMPPPAIGYSEVAGPGSGFGLGFSVKLSATTGRQIGTAGEFAWGGAANTIFWIDPAERMFVVWMTQVLGQDRQRNPIREVLGSIVHGSIVDRLPFAAAL